MFLYPVTFQPGWMYLSIITIVFEHKHRRELCRLQLNLPYLDFALGRISISLLRKLSFGINNSAEEMHRQTPKCRLSTVEIKE